MKIGVLADSIVIKKLQNRDILSPQKNIDSFYQEVAVMAFASFLFFFFFQLTSSKFINLFRTLLFHPYVCQLLGYSENPNCIVMPKYEVINNTEHEKPKIKSNHNPPIFTIQGSLMQLIHQPTQAYNSLHLADLLYQACSALSCLFFCFIFLS